MAEAVMNDWLENYGTVCQRTVQSETGKDKVSALSSAVPLTLSCVYQLTSKSSGSQYQRSRHDTLHCI